MALPIIVGFAVGCAQTYGPYTLKYYLTTPKWLGDRLASESMTIPNETLRRAETKLRKLPKGYKIRELPAILGITFNQAKSLVIKCEYKLGRGRGRPAGDYKRNWAKYDWVNLSNRDLAVKLGVSTQYIAERRKTLRFPKYRNGQPLSKQISQVMCVR